MSFIARTSTGKLGALLQGATCTRHLYGTTTASHQQLVLQVLLWTLCCVCQIFLISQNTNLFFTLVLPLNILWKENIPAFENSSKAIMVNLFILSWLFVIGLIVTTFSSGPLYLYTFEKRDIGLWNKALIQLWQPKLNFPFISQFFIPGKGIIHRQPFSNSRRFGIQSLWRKKMEAYWWRSQKDLAFTSVSKSSTCLAFATRPWLKYSKTLWTNTTYSKFELQACMDATHYDDWPPIYQKPIRSWPSKPLMEPYNFIEENPLAKWDLLKRPDVDVQIGETLTPDVTDLVLWGYNEQLLHVTDLPSRLYT